MEPGMKAALVGFALLTFACGCERQPSEPPKSQPPPQAAAQPPAPPPPDAARADPAEAKRLRLAEIMRETAKARKEPKDSRSLARQVELQKLAAEAQTIARELAGDDEKKQQALYEEVAKQYLPDQYLEFQVMRAKNCLAMIDQALEMYKLDTARYPSTEQGLRVLTDKTSARGPYLANEIPKDPWGRDYLYRYPGTRDANDCDLKSLGPDGKEGTPDDVEQ